MNLQVVTQTGREILWARESVSGKFTAFLYAVNAGPKMLTSDVTPKLEYSLKYFNKDGIIW